MSEREWCNCESAWMEMGYCLANCEVAEPAGADGETPHELAARIVAEYTAYDWGMAPANELKLARALLSSPRVEEVRREALEEAAAAVEGMGWSTAEQAFTALEIALLIRSLSPQGG